MSAPVTTHFLIIFGARVRADGSPSGSLARRIDGALALARSRADVYFLVTGGQGEHGPPEAHVMRDRLIAAGVDPARILVDDRSKDTLQSVRACAAMLRGQRGRVLVCSSNYHNPRCALLLQLLGIPARIPRMPADRPALGLLRWLYMVLREAPATLYDSVLVLTGR